MTKTTDSVAPHRLRLRQRGRVSLRSLVIVLAIIAALGALAWWLGGRSSSRPAGGAPGMGGPGGPPGMMMGGGRGGGMATTVGTAQATAQDFPVVIEALGTVTPTATVTVRPQVSGVITEVRFEEGQTVSKNQVLAVIDPRPFQTALQQAQGQLQRDEAELQNAKLQLERYRTLLEQDSIAQQEVDTQTALVEQLQGTVVADRASVAAAQLDLDYAYVKSPVTGRVGLRVIDAGNYIGAGDANGIAVVTQATPTDVIFTVPQDFVGEIRARLAEKAEMKAIALDRTRQVTLGEGRFSTLDNVVSPETGTVRAKARFENADGALFPSQFVNLRLVVRTIEKAVVVPVSAVRNGAEGDFVWLLQEDRTVTQRKVRRGQAAGDRVQIVEGLSLGETVVTEGGDRLREGARVVVPADKPGAAGAPQRAGENGAGERRERRRGQREGGGAGGPASGPP